ncbi:MAG: beta-ketoacyl synthase [Chlorobi bacterium]|nr:beta-ketoacyl synthase [Chlorobiota bacterium]
MIYFITDNIITSLGFNTAENFAAVKAGHVGIEIINDKTLYPDQFPASLVNTERLDEEFAKLSAKEKFTRLEKMLILSVTDALKHSDVDIRSDRTGIILSTTKGNIDLLEPQKKQMFEEDRLHLWKLGRVLAGYFGNPNEPVVLSNACISGVLAINIAAGLIRQGKYDNMVVTGGDIVSQFVVSGFMSFMSLSPKPCKPFDEARDGLSLGEGAGTIILSNKGRAGENIIFKGGGSANDANHISGPSRTGEGSYIAIERAFREAGVAGKDIDHISAHGTATSYNDEMESIAIGRHRMEHVPVSSFKGNWGHTLGAAGIVETAMMLTEMKENLLLKTAGFEKPGVSVPVNVIDKTENKTLNTCLKMASGFGGTNAALVVRKIKV